VSRIRVTKGLVEAVTAGWAAERRASFAGALSEEVDDGGRIETARVIALAAETRVVETEPSEDALHAANMAAMGVEVEPLSADEVAERRLYEATQRRFAAEQESEARRLADREREENAAVDAVWSAWAPLLTGPET
jgi:hypothetical protein